MLLEQLTIDFHSCQFGLVIGLICVIIAYSHEIIKYDFIPRLYFLFVISDVDYVLSMYDMY